MNALIGDLVQKLGVDESQAQGGAGLLFKLAQAKLGGDFARVSTALPGVETLIGQAPAAGGAAKLLGGLGAALGGSKAADLASLAGSFAQLKLDPAMIGKFVPVLLSFAQAKGGQDILALLTKVLK